jgi:DNA polymerase III subunit gamma/tau
MAEYQPLFLKYRPQALADLIGQDSVAKTLANAIEHDRIFHAYLFTGPRGTGKTSSARILAKSLNCVNGPTPTPCQVCTSCEEIRRGNSASVFEIDAASNNSVDDARLLIERAPLVAPGGRYKIYIIDECHMLTKEAFNALLKTIEEPPPNVVFVLATTEEQKVLPTIVSRCQRLMFRLVNQSELTAYLEKIACQEKIEIEADALAFVARRSAGGLRDALGLLDQASLLGVPGQPVKIQDLLLLSGCLNEDMVAAIGESILNQDGESALKAVLSLLEDGREPYLIAQELAKHFLNLAKASYVNDKEDENGRRWLSGSPEYVDRLLAQKDKLDRAEVSYLVEALDRLEQTCKRSTQPALNLEVGILSLCHRLDATDLRALKERVAVLEREINPGATPEIARPKKVEAAKLERTASAKPVAKAYEAKALTKESQGDSAAPESAVEAVHKPALTMQLDEPKAPEMPVGAKMQESAIALLDPAEEAVRPADWQDEGGLALNVTIDALQSQADLPANAVDVSADAYDLDLIWQELLEELQKRNIPTYSLVSTHAFPVAISETELTIGVLVEHFQKMIESKLEHIKAAVQIVQGRALVVKVRIANQSKEGAERKTVAGQAKQGKGTEREPSPPALGKEGAAASPTAEPKGAIDNPAEPAVTNSLKGASLRNTTAHVVQEAYKLFEGPGSRLITSF